MRISTWTALGLFAAAALACAEARSADNPRHADFGEMPRGHSGIASKYPGDAGIERDPDVLLVEDFEHGRAEAFRKKWKNIGGEKHMKFVDDAPGGSAGTKSVQMEAQLGRNSGGHLFTYVKDSDVLFARLYAKFERGSGPIHHFCEIRGERDRTGWPAGAAGVVPRGDERFFTMFDFKKRDKVDFTKCEVMFYTYWQHMKGKWGTNYLPKERFHPQYDKWHCFEWMLKANSAPDADDGEQAMWADGELLMRMTGFKWRSTNKLKCNTFWLKYYVTDHSTTVKTNRMRFDHVVVARKYVGPIAKKTAARLEAVSSEAATAEEAAAAREASGKAIAEKEAARLYQMARQAERMGQRVVAKQLYEQIVEKYPGTGVAAKARRELSRWAPPASEREPEGGER